MKEKIHGDEHTLLVLLYTYIFPQRFPYSPTPAIHVLSVEVQSRLAR